MSSDVTNEVNTPIGIVNTAASIIRQRLSSEAITTFASRTTVVDTEKPNDGVLVSTSNEGPDPCRSPHKTQARSSVLTLTGRLVLDDVEAELRGALDGLIRQGRVKLVLNLQDVIYVDSAGLGFLVSKYVSVHRRGGDMKLVRVQPRVAHVLGDHPVVADLRDLRVGRGRRAGIRARARSQPGASVQADVALVPVRRRWPPVTWGGSRGAGSTPTTNAVVALCRKGNREDTLVFLRVFASSWLHSLLGSGESSANPPAAAATDPISAVSQIAA